MYKLEDSWSESGTNLDEFIKLTEEVEKATHFIRAKYDDLKFYHRIIHPMVQMYKVVVVTPGLLDKFVDGLAAYKTDLNATMPEVDMGTLKKSNMNMKLADESFANAGFIITCKKVPYYVASGAKTTIVRRVKLGGDNMSRNTLYVTAAIADALGSARRSDITLVTRQITNPSGKTDRKVFAFMSGKYQPIPQSVMQDVIAEMKNSGMGKPEVVSWYIDQTLTSINIEFPDAAKDMKDMYGLKDEIIPGVTIMSADTGTSSFIVQGTCRQKGRKTSVAPGNDYSHQHAGKITAKEVLKGVDKDVFREFRKLPEALADKMGRTVGTGNVSTPKAQAANKTAVKKAIKTFITKTKVKSEIGKDRTEKLLEALYAEINPEIVYTEYDIATLVMGVPDRVVGLSKEQTDRLVKACGRAPFVDLKKAADKEAAEDIVLLPEA